MKEVAKKQTAPLHTTGFGIFGMVLKKPIRPIRLTSSSIRMCIYAHAIQLDSALRKTAPSPLELGLRAVKLAWHTIQRDCFDETGY